MISIAITGGIGSGKSYVCKQLEAMGVPIYDADSQAKQLMLTDPVIKEQLVALLGEDVYEHGQLNKKMLAEYLFAEASHADLINGIVHPRVKHHFLMWLQSNADKEIAGMECAILFESGFDQVVDKVVMVTAPEPLRLERAMKRDAATQQQIKARMNMQMPDAEKERRSHFSICNDGKMPVEPQIAALIEKLKEENKRKICESAR